MAIRVLHVIGSLGCGGAQVVLKHLVENMDSNEVEAYVYPLRCGQVQMPIKGTVITRPYRNYDPRKFWTILRLCRDYDIDILVAHLTKPIIACLLASFFCRAKLIVYEHGPVFAKGLQYTLYRVVLKLLWRRVAVFIAVSEYMSAYLGRKIGIERGRIRVLHNAVEFGVFDPEQVSAKSVREQIGISDSDVVVGYVGRLDHLKGPDLLIRAAAYLLEQSGKYLFLLVGDGSLRNRLKKSAQRLGISERVRFLGFCDNAPEIMASFDIGVVPSRLESFGITCLELMRMRIPIVSSGAGGMAEYITNGQTGLLLKENTPEEICKSIARLASDEQLRRRLIEGGSRLVEEFTVEKYVEATRKIYCEVLRNTESIRFNIKAHDRIARRYEKVHDEIFNDIEQARLRDALQEATKAIKSGRANLRALDVGCGSGNLTRHLIDSGLFTVSADVSENFLRLIDQNFSKTGLSKTLRLNGRDLANIDDCTFDIAAAYSVLHHVPDYPLLVREMCRVLKRGGVIYLDHEANETRYSRPREYVEFLELATPTSAVLRKYLRLLLSFTFYVNFIKKRIDPRYIGEGDIHVWPDDHIEWEKVEQLLHAQNFEIILKRDYLVYRGSYHRAVYELYKHTCADTTMLVARKK